MSAAPPAEDNTPTDPIAAPQPRPTPRRTALGHAVADRVRLLQRLSNEDTSQAVSQLAELRRAVGSAPGQDPAVWSNTLALVPEGDFDPSSDEPSSAELAAHHAVTLFALHRQGRVSAAHVDGVPPGLAFARLARRRGGEGDSEGVRRRFDALLTAPGAAESAGHLRGLVQLLRSEDIGLDYGLMAEDLADLWSVRRQNNARLRWARQYRGYRGETNEPVLVSGTTTKD